jgi:hypothetical protein
MNKSDHDYSRHTDDELHDAVSTMDAAKYPDRAASLLRELETRLERAKGIASAATSKQATTRGASFDELDARSASRFFWPFLGFTVFLSCLWGFLGGFIGGFLGSLFFGSTVLLNSPSGIPLLTTVNLSSLIVSIAMIVPFWRFWLKRATRRTFGGFTLRILHDTSDST